MGEHCAVPQALKLSVSRSEAIHTPGAFYPPRILAPSLLGQGFGCWMFWCKLIFFCLGPVTSKEAAQLHARCLATERLSLCFLVIRGLFHKWGFPAYEHRTSVEAKDGLTDTAIYLTTRSASVYRA